jgi:hypothetical protein
MKGFLRRLFDDRGGVGDYLMGATLFAFVALFPVAVAIPLQRVWALQHIKAQLLEDLVWEGQVPLDIQDRLLAAARAYPYLDPAKLELGPDTTPIGVPVQFRQPITLQIGHPQGKLLTAAFIGLDWDPDRIVWVTGTVTSQRPWR